MILGKYRILEEIKKGNIKIEPFDPEFVGPASVDLRLGNNIRVLNGTEVDISNGDADYRKITEKIDISDGYWLEPGELVLGITLERITLSSDIAGWLSTRSRFARIGLMVHITAPFVSPGVSNQQVLEIYNASKMRIKIRPGLPVCQIVFEHVSGGEKYSGRFSAQTTDNF